MKARILILAVVVVLSLGSLTRADDKADFQTKFDAAFKHVQEIQAQLDKANASLNDLLKQMDSKGFTLQPKDYTVTVKPPVTTGVPPAK